MLDVNVGAASVDEVALLPQAVQLVQDTVDLPVSLDSANPDAIAAALCCANCIGVERSTVGLGLE